MKVKDVWWRQDKEDGKYSRKYIKKKTRSIPKHRVSGDSKQGALSDYVVLGRRGKQRLVDASVQDEHQDGVCSHSSDAGHQCVQRRSIKGKKTNTD